MQAQPELTKAAAGAPATALAALWQRLRRRAGRTAVFMVVMCSAIGVLLTALSGGRLGVHLVYSFCVGTACFLITDAVRLAVAAGSDALRRRRGLAPQPEGPGSSWGGVVPAVLLAALLGPAVGLSLGDLLTGYRTPSLLSLESTTTRVTLTISFIASIVAVFVLSAGERLALARAQAEAAQRLAAENQLRLLQSQLEPHMLFNTLANLRVLITLDPPRAQAMLDHLIAFLRGTLSASRASSHTLATEFDHLADYLALMAVRMGPRLQVALDLPEALRALPVPPLLLQPLVENSIKHGLEPQVDGGCIEVQARAVGGVLRLTVRDTGVGLSKLPAPASGFGLGFGLEQVRQRLATLHGERAALALEPAAAGGTLATVTLPMPTT